MEILIMETWKLFKQIDDMSYEVSSHGRVRSIKIFSPNLRGGYLCVATKANKNKKHLIHGLVAKAFIENNNLDTYTVVHHKNGNKLDNNVDNLEWTTQSRNIFEYFNHKKSRK